MFNKKTDRQIAIDEFEKYLVSGFREEMAPRSYSIVLAMNALQTLEDIERKDYE